MRKKQNNLIGGLTGLFLILAGGTMPQFFSNWSRFVVDSVMHSITHSDSGLVIIASFVYMARCLLIFFPIYYGSMLLTSSLAKSQDPVTYPYFFAGICLFNLTLLNYLYNTNFSYSGQLFFIGLILLLQMYNQRYKYFYFTYGVNLLFALLAAHWLQLIPALTVFGFGTNDLATSIKTADSFLTGNSLLNTIASVFFIVFLTIAFIFTLLLHLSNKQIDTLKKYQVQEEELKETKTALVESKVYKEINMLVHDLKTPLVTVQGLISLIEMKLQGASSTPFKNYFTRMEHSVEKMKDMISEILSENIKQELTVKELLEYVTSHLSLDEQQVNMEIELDDNLPCIQVNKIRFSRAISNIIENAISSFAGKKGNIHVDVKSINREVIFKIKDDGPGIKSEHIESIWQDGFSTKNSSGIGLSFVRRVIQNHGGKVNVHSIPGSYTQMVISLPILEAGDEVNEYHYTNS
ncbi:sensor histidine kinase [Virgibacillus kekensis]|uniref:histidine kinase n=1 Tax=Virgibacillus kekensis TaxID=202261 RepID=A0ABV9DGH8_9BACI